MKKFNYLIILLLLGGLVLISCSEDDDDNPDEILAPSLSFLGGTYEGTNMQYVDADKTLTVGEQFVFGITAKSLSNKDLESVIIERTYEVISTIELLNLNLSSSNYTYDSVVAAYPYEGMEEFICTVTDKNDKTSTISFTITTVMEDPGINVFNNIELGSWNSTTNSSFGSITGETYSITEAAADSIQSNIDWVYFNGATWGHTLMSPSDTITEDIYPTIADWTVRNQTRFAKTPYDQAVFNIIENDNQLVVYINQANLNFIYDFYSQLNSNPGGFAVNDVIAFETHLGHYGLILVTEVNQNAGNDLSTIKYNVKVVK